MTIDLAESGLIAAAAERPWQQPATYWPSLANATQDHSAPVVALGVEALAANAGDLVRRAGGLPIRVASKSIRVRSVLESVLATPGFRGVLAYTLAEAVWLSETIDDIVVGYPSADRAAIAELASDERAAARVTLMIDDEDQLDLIDAVLPPAKRHSLRVCLELDASWHSGALGRVGVLRSPVRTAEELGALAETVARRPGFELVGVMAYEAQIAGVGDAPRDRPARAALLRAVQRASGAELAGRRGEAVAAVRAVAPLEFVNGGGTGSLERTSQDPAVTELAAGSGLFGPHLFDDYRSFTPAPALAFALDVTRRPNSETATVHGGGWIASGPAGPDRLPEIAWPEGLRFAPREGAGEVQTPVIGPAARGMRVGDRVWLRHAKSGEPMEHVNEVVPVRAGRGGANGAVAEDPLLTYRGEGRCFL